MFNIGLSEFLVIIAIAIVVFGPDRSVKFARRIGETVRGLQRQVGNLQKSFGEGEEPKSGESSDVDEST